MLFNIETRMFLSGIHPWSLEHGIPCREDMSKANRHPRIFLSGIYFIKKYKRWDQDHKNRKISQYFRIYFVIEEVLI
jgi:hypothetical protein